jgi:hypothetical protein
MACEQKALLEARVQSCLSLLSELAQAEGAAMRAENSPLMLEIDLKLENAVGEKERQIGALKQHTLEHGC